MKKARFAGLPVIALSGWAFGPEAVQPLAAALPPGAPFSALTPIDLETHDDARAVGSSRDYADSLSRTIAATGRPAVLAGWSLGALIALETAIRSPRQVAALVLIGATARFCRAPRYPAGTPATLLDAMLARLATNPADVLTAFVERAFLPDRADERALRLVRERAADSAPDALAGGLRHLAATDLREMLHVVDCPTLILHGDQDRIIPVAAAAWLHRRLPASRLEIVQGAGHVLPLNRREELGERIGAFFRALPPA